jgi:peptidylamidoglycolate lyase
VCKFSHDGKRLLTLGEPRVGGWDATHFNQPTDIAIRADGSFYVGGRLRQQPRRALRSRRPFPEGVGKEGRRPGEFSNPHGLAFGAGGDVLVADRENSRIQIFDRGGAFKRQWLGAKEKGRVFAVTVDADGFLYVGVRTTSPADGSIYVTETRTRRVVKLRPVK